MEPKILTIIICLFFVINSNAQWQPDVRLTNNPPASCTSINYGWCIAASGDTVHIEFYDERNGNYTQVYYKRSTDKGTTWSSDTRLSTSNTYAERGSIAVNGPMVHAVWQDMRYGAYEILYRRSTDGGSTWEPELRLTNDPSQSYGPGIIVSGSSVHVFWTDLRNGLANVYYKRSIDGGITWGNDVRLSTGSGESWYPVCAASGPAVHMVWSDNRDGNYEIYYKRSIGGGLDWGPDTRLTNENHNSTNPNIVTIGPNVHVAWHDDRDGNSEIYYKRSIDVGITWGNDTRITNSAGDSYFPSLNISGNNLHMVWEDSRDGNYEIYYKQSSNAGLTWGSDTRLTNATGDSHYPSITSSGTYVHVVWFDERDGNREIYYKQNPTGNGPPPVPLPPVLVSPPNESINQPTTIRFIWNRSQYALTYRLQLALDSLFTNLTINDSTLTDSTILVTNLLVNRYYWWRLNAKNSSGISAWSNKFRFNTFPVGISKNNSEIPKEYNLYQNNPNPFNPSTKIRFDIPTPLAPLYQRGEGVAGEFITLRVYDILGRVVITLVNEKLSPGTYEVTWNASNYPSGVYFYKLETMADAGSSTESFSETRKMLLVK